MGNVYMEADQIRYRGQYRNVQEALDNGGGGGGGGTAAGVSYSNTDSHLTATNVQAAIDEMVANFGDGVDDVYNACVSAGSTPASKSPADIATAIGSISGGADIILDNGQIGTNEGTYITAPLTGELIANSWLLVSIHDGSNKYNEVVEYTGGSNTFSLVNGTFALTVTATTAGLSDYSGDWRNIYAIISVLDSSQVY